jgi:ParB-like chromosome segregation protein Spo0J
VQRDGVEVDLHQLELRHRDLRIHDGEQRRRLIGSVAEVGQLVPVVVIRDADRLVLIDGYLRVEALRRLHRDTAIATTWPVTEIEALVHHRHLSGAKRVALEDAWLLGRLREHGLTMEQLARQLCRSTSWVSRRLGLLDALDGSAQDRVRAGTVPAHAAMKYLVPLARANKAQCAQLIAGLGDTQVSVRELGLEARGSGWQAADRRRAAAGPARTGGDDRGARGRLRPAPQRPDHARSDRVAGRSSCSRRRSLHRPIDQGVARRERGVRGARRHHRGDPCWTRPRDRPS